LITTLALATGVGVGVGVGVAWDLAAAALEGEGVLLAVGVVPQAARAMPAITAREPPIRIRAPKNRPVTVEITNSLLARKRERPHRREEL
jgi:hypothetical protein